MKDERSLYSGKISVSPLALPATLERLFSSTIPVPESVCAREEDQISSIAGKFFGGNNTHDESTNTSVAQEELSKNTPGDIEKKSRHKMIVF